MHKAILPSGQNHTTIKVAIGLVHRDAVELVSEESGCVCVSLAFVRQALNYAYGLVLIPATTIQERMTILFTAVLVFLNLISDTIPLLKNGLNGRHQHIKII